MIRGSIKLLSSYFGVPNCPLAVLLDTKYKRNGLIKFVPAEL